MFKNQGGVLMKKELDSVIFGALKKNILLLLSTMAVLCLFVTPTVMITALCAGIFLAVIVMVIYAAKDGKTRNEQPLTRTGKRSAILLTILLEYMGLHSFFSTWSSSRKVAALAAAFHLSAQDLLLIVGIAGCVVGAYALYRLSAFIVEKMTEFLKHRLPVQDRKEAVENMKRNWFFPISAAAFFCLYFGFSIVYLLALVIALICVTVAASQTSSIWGYVHRQPAFLKLFSALSAAGICLCRQKVFLDDWSVSSKIQALNAALPGPVDILGIFGILGAVVGFFFVYVCLLFFWREMEAVTEGTNLTEGVGKWEILIYAALILAAAVFVTAVFSKTQAFYGTEASYDLIYTSDSPSLVKGHVWVSLLHAENDLRQPLFAVFAAPFMGFPYLLSGLLPLSTSAEAILLDYAQVLMFFAANYLLARAMGLDALKRTCFMIFLCGTYTCPLFLLMMEQYIVAYFWLMFCIYLIAEKNAARKLPFTVREGHC